MTGYIIGIRIYVTPLGPVLFNILDRPKSLINILDQCAIRVIDEDMLCYKEADTGM